MNAEVDAVQQREKLEYGFQREMAQRRALERKMNDLAQINAAQFREHAGEVAMREIGRAVGDKFIQRIQDVGGNEEMGRVLYHAMQQARMGPKGRLDRKRFGEALTGAIGSLPSDLITRIADVAERFIVSDSNPLWMLPHEYINRFHMVMEAAEVYIEPIITYSPHLLPMDATVRMRTSVMWKQDILCYDTVMR